MLKKKDYKTAFCISAQYANMTVFLAVRTSIANWVLIPFLSKWLEDTTLIMVSQVEIYQDCHISCLLMYVNIP